MGYNIRVTEAFEEDLFDTLAHLVQEYGAEGAARKVMQAVDEAKELLASLPFVNAVSSKPRFAEKGYREQFVLNYVIVYKVDGEEVVFLRFFHQTRLYERFIMEWK